MQRTRCPNDPHVNIVNRFAHIGVCICKGSAVNRFPTTEIECVHILTLVVTLSKRNTENFFRLVSNSLGVSVHFLISYYCLFIFS